MHRSKTSFVLLEAEVKISGSANHRALQTGFDTAATNERGADLACLLERSPGLASEPLLGRDGVESGL